MIVDNYGLFWWGRRLSESNFVSALAALKINVVQVGVAFVQKVLFAILKAIWADPVNWFAAAHGLLYNVGNRSRTNALQLIAIPLRIPRFYPDDFLVEVA